jgi:hypothetical protein
MASLAPAKKTIKAPGKKSAKPKVKLKTAKPAADPYAADVKAAVDLKYQPQYDELQNELKVSRQMDTNLHGWYGNYLSQINQANAAQNAGYQDAATRIGALTDASTQVDRSNRTDLINRLSADAQRRGATVDPSIDQTGVQAEASRRTGLDEAQAATLRTGALENAYLADRGRIAAGAEVGAHQAEAGRRATVRATRQKTKLQAADYGQTVRTSLKSAESNRQLALATLGSKASIAQLNASTKLATAQTSANASLQSAKIRADATLKAARARQAAGKPLSATQKIAVRKDRYQRRHHTGPYAPAKGTKPKAESTASKNARAEIGDARVRIQQWRAAQPGITSHEITVHLRNEKYSDAAINAARDLVFLGHLSGPNRARLRRHGVRIPKGW